MLKPTKHCDKVRFIGVDDRPYLINGMVYTTFGHYPPLVSDKYTRDEIRVYVNDPEDDFGGVLSRPAKDFENV
jgi:hypothetical protein